MFKSNSYRLLATAMLLALCFVLGNSEAFAQVQASTGQISGSVRDNQGAAIAGATVKVTNTQTGSERIVAANSEGLFVFVLLPPGVYNLTAEAQSFSKGQLNGITVYVGQIAAANVTLGVGTVTEAVTVVAGGVQTTVSQPDAVFNSTAIANLPINGRRFQDFVQLTPTALIEPSRNQISLSGQRGINSNVSIDGADYNQPFFGGIRGGERSNNAYTIPQESVGEFQVVSAGYSAEFGRSSGGIVNVVTKSGTNQYHGSAFYLHRDKELARLTDYFEAFQQDLRSRGLNQTVQPAPTQKQWGGSFGGPIKKDRMFFFSSYEQQRVRQERAVYYQSLRLLSADQIAALTPASRAVYNNYIGTEGPFQQTNDAITFLGRFDYEISSKNRLNVRYNYSRNEGLNANATGDSPDPITTRALSNNGTEKNDTNTVVGQFNSFIRPELINELRVQYSRENRPRIANSTDTNLSTAIGNLGNRNFLSTTQFDWRFQLANNLSWIVGNHSLKFGTEINHVFANQTFGFNQYGQFFLNATNVNSAGNVIQILDLVSGTNSPGAATTPALRGPYDDPTRGRFVQQVGNLQAEFATDEFALFAQDSWRITKSFTFNYGLRWEGQFLPQPEADNRPLVDLVRNYRSPIGTGRSVDPSRFPNLANQLAPRAGFAWDPKANGKTVIRGFSGLYYARTPLLLLAGPFNNFRFPAGDLSVTLPFALPTNFTPTAGCANRGACDSLFEQLSLIGYNFNQTRPLSVNDITGIAQRLGLAFNPQLLPGISPTAFANDYKNPKSFQVGGGVEHELFGGWSVGADFSLVNTVYLQRNRELNLPAPISFPLANGDPSLRPFFGVAGSLTINRPEGGTLAFTQRLRPLQDPTLPTQLNSLALRESTARSLYRSFVARTNLRRKWGQFSAFYTLSSNYSDDDNERDAGGFNFQNTFDLAPEYGYSNLDQRHQFLANAVVFLPLGFEVSGSARFTSARPLNTTVGTDVNQDGVNNDRPYSAPGVSFKRNAFRNRPFSNIDFRAQKRFSFTESKNLVISAEFFNLLNFSNIQFAGTAVTNYCTGVNVASRAGLDCGFSGPTNVNFRSLTEKNPSSTRFGQLLLNNSPGQIFQMQLGARFQF